MASSSSILDICEVAVQEIALHGREGCTLDFLLKHLALVESEIVNSVWISLCSRSDLLIIAPDLLGDTSSSMRIVASRELRLHALGIECDSADQYPVAYDPLLALLEVLY